MKLVGIVTMEHRSDIWDQTKDWQPESKFPKTVVRVKAVGDDRVAVLRQASSRKLSDDDRIRESRYKTTDWLVELSNSETCKGAEIYVAAHAGLADFKMLRKNISNRRFCAGADFSHQKGDELFEDLLTLVKNVDSKNFKAVIESIGEHQERTYAERLATLKHRMAHVFLPISVDLHTWQEFGFDDLYLQELRESYKSDEGRLERARSLLYDDEFSAADNVEKVIRESEFQDNELWETLKLLLPPQSAEEKIFRDQPEEYELFLNAKAVLESFNDADKLKALRAELRQHDAFSAWCTELDNRLSELVFKVDS